MAKYERGILGPPIGKLGSIMGYRRGGQEIIQSIGERKGNNTIMTYTKNKVLELESMMAWVLINKEGRDSWATFNGPGANAQEKRNNERDRIITENKLRTVTGFTRTSGWAPIKNLVTWVPIEVNDKIKIPTNGELYGYAKNTPKRVVIFGSTVGASFTLLASQNMTQNDVPITIEITTAMMGYGGSLLANVYTEQVGGFIISSSLIYLKEKMW